VLGRHLLISIPLDDGRGCLEVSGPDGGRSQTDGSRGIPAISGLRGILRHVKTGDTVIVDGRGGHVLVNPDPEQRSAYLKLEREFVLLKDQLAANRDLPARTADGHSLELLANVNSPADAKAAVGMGASGVGLFRTEYQGTTLRDHYGLAWPKSGFGDGAREAAQ